MFTNLRRTALKAIDTLLPPRCIVTGDIVDRQGMTAPTAWADLSFIAPPLCRQCGFPFGFIDGDETEEEDGMLCGSCIRSPPPFTKARAALIYDDRGRHPILRFKHADQLHAVHTFTPWLMRAGAEMLDKAHVIVPVPLHPTRLWRRRYNQAALLGQALGKETGIPCLSDALRRLRATKIQGRMGQKERQANVKNAFAVNLKHRSFLEGKSVVLIDDVYTIGATVNECTKALLKAGAAEVNVLTVARVVRASGG